MSDPFGQQGSATNPAGEAPKIVVDSDWKVQAQKEREKLAQKEQEAAEKAKASKGAMGGAPGPGGEPQGMPPADFQALIGTMVTQALMYMGAFPDESGRAMVSLEHAKFYIDLLSVLEIKTKGNVTPEEAQDITQSLSELRMRFVEIVQTITQMKKDGKLKPGAGGAGGPGGLVSGGPGGLTLDVR